MLDLYFITSNRTKLAHARFLSRAYDVTLHKQKQYGVGYIEPRIQEREQLLSSSIEDAVSRLGKVVNNLDEKFIFIEDTSVIINALSTSETEVPGLDIKYWMQQRQFGDIDALLKAAGNDRSVIVRSDIILFLPKILRERLGVRYQHFTGITNGKIVESEVEIMTQAFYPWLSGKSFNKWFVPEGRSVPISTLDIVSAEQSDFRKGSFDGMYYFLKAHGFVSPKKSFVTHPKQLNLFNVNIFIVCGPTCAGKTTIAKYLTRRYGFYHIEASDFMHLSYYETHGVASEVKIGDFAQAALTANPSIVVDQIVEHLSDIKFGTNIPVVISGFRAPSEIEEFKKKYRGGLDIEEIYVDAEITRRFSRACTRGRNDRVLDFPRFLTVNQQQDAMGLSQIKEMISYENWIFNEDTIDDFYRSFEEQFGEGLQFFSMIKEGVHFLIDTAFPKSIRLADVILITMANHTDEFLTTTQITHLINSRLPTQEKKEKDNVSRYFNYKYYPYYEIKCIDGRVRYRLSQTGISLVELLLQRLAKRR